MAKTDTETESFRSIVKKYFIFSILFCQKHFHAQYHKVNVVKLLFDLKGHCLQLELTEGKNDVVVGGVEGEQQYCRKWHLDKVSKTGLGQNAEKKIQKC